MDKTFTLANTEFFRLLTDGEVKDPNEINLHYRDFILKVVEVSNDNDKLHAINALLFVEVEFSHLKTKSERDEANTAIVNFVHKALSFIRKSIANVKSIGIIPVSVNDTIQSIDLTWKASKTDLVELAYAFKIAECFGKKATVKDIVAKLAKAFKVELPENYIYKKHNEMRVRARNSRTYFLDTLGNCLRGFMQKLDS